LRHHANDDQDHAFVGVLLRTDGWNSPSSSPRPIQVLVESFFWLLPNIGIGMLVLFGF
jgi:hypothetical protein